MRRAPKLLPLILSAALMALLALPLAAPREAAAAGDFRAGNRVFVNTDALNVRSGPSTDDTVVDTITTGTLATVQDGPQSGSGYTWYKIKVDNGTTGWSVADYLALATDGDGWPAGTNVSVDTDALNLRSGPSLSNGVVAVLPQGTSGTVQDGPVNQDGYTWYQVTAAGSTGWSVAMYLAAGGSGDNGGGTNGGGTNGGGNTGGGATAVVDVPALNLRSGHGLSYDVIDILTQGQTITINTVEASGTQGPVNQDGYDWYNVTTADGTTGWAVNGFTITDRGGNSSGFSAGDQVVVADGPLNVRAAAGTDADVVDTIANGTQLTILSGPTTKGGYTWYQVSYGNSGQGWVAGEFLGAA